MKHTKLVTAALILVCTLLLAGCGSPQGEQAAHSGTTANSQNGEQNANLDDLLDTALLRGSVADFQDGSFQVVPDKDDGQMIISAADDMESGMESTTVSYEEDCTFRIAHIDSSTGAVEYEAAASSDVKKSTSVYVYGETQDNGEIHAEKVLIIRFNDQEG